MNMQIQKKNLLLNMTVILEISMQFFSVYPKVFIATRYSESNHPQCA